MHEENDMLLICDKLNRLLFQLEITAASAYLMKEGMIYAEVEPEIASKAVELLLQVLDQEVTDAATIKQMISGNTDQERYAKNTVEE